MSNTKFCVNCKHYDVMSECMHPESFMTSMVTGERISSSAIGMRRHEDLCGQTARLFEVADDGPNKTALGVVTRLENIKQEIRFIEDLLQYSLDDRSTGLGVSSIASTVAEQTYQPSYHHQDIQSCPTAVSQLEESDCQPEEL